MKGTRSGGLVLLIIGLIVVGCEASSFSTSRKLNGWIKSSRADPTSPISLRIALRQRNLDKLETIVKLVSDPKSGLYGKYLTLPQLTALVSPPAESIDLVMNWLKSEDILASLTVNKDYLNIKTNVATAERVFDVLLYNYYRNNTSAPIIRAGGGYSVPGHLGHHIDHIFGIAEFPPVLRRTGGGRGNAFKLGAAGDEPGINVNPSIIKQTYKIDVTGTDAVSQACAEFEEAYFYESDLTLFQEKYQLPLQNLSHVIGPNHPDEGYLGEATLDVEYIVGIGTGVDTWVFSTAGTGFDLVGWATTVMATPNAPKVHSVSWGSGENDLDLDFIRSANTEFQKFASLGYSILAASGDEGTGSTGDFFCGTFNPTFPATSPYVTAVGGTYIDGTTNQEIAVYFSGGGFSTIFTRPDYQNTVVQNYLQNTPNLPASDYYNGSGRAIPDVSAVATNFEVIIQAYADGTMSGTSAATPVFAGIVSLLNSIRKQAGKPELGFLNPWLYTFKTIGTDITEGNNKVSNCPQGFSATTGWDAISGLGAPIFSTLVNSL